MLITSPSWLHPNTKKQCVFVSICQYDKQIAQFHFFIYDDQTGGDFVIVLKALRNPASGTNYVSNFCKIGKEVSHKISRPI